MPCLVLSHATSGTPCTHVHAPLHKCILFGVTCILAFNVGNYLGIVITGLVQWPRSTSDKWQMTKVLLVAPRFISKPIFMTRSPKQNRREEVRDQMNRLLSVDAGTNIFYNAVILTALD